MKSQKQILIKTTLLASIMILAIISTQARADNKSWIVVRDGISEDTQRFNVKLKYTQSKSCFYEATKQNIKSEKIEDKRKKGGYTQQLNLGKEIDENQYILMIKDAAEMNFITNNSERLCAAKVIQLSKNKKSKVLKEGLIYFHRELEIPLELSPEQAIVPCDQPVKGALKINIYSNNSALYEGRCHTILNGDLSGSITTKTAFLNVSVICKKSLELKERYLTLSIKPFDDQMAPICCTGKISETLRLGTSKLVVEKIAADSSELVLALLRGDLTSVKKQDIAVTAVGKPFPAFARVELVNRKLLTLKDLRKQAGEEGYIVLIFGGFKIDTDRFHGRSSQMQSLSLDETMIFNILKKDCKKNIVVGFVCQRLLLSALYEKWLEHIPEFYVFSDFSNPLNVQFVSANMDSYMQRFSDRSETLRGNLGFENENIIAALIDGNGNTVYLNTNAGNELAATLVQINSLMIENKKAEKDKGQDIKN